jgi:N-acetylmuramoyl-L-alanine amidase
MASIVISSGHGLYVRGASGYCDEVDEARRIVDRVTEMLQSANVKVTKFHDNTSHSQSENLSTITNFHNAQPSHTYDVSVHLNAYTSTTKPMGVEVLYVTQEDFADRMSESIAAAGHFIDRGPKYRSDLAFLNNTRAKSILIETMFCDSRADTDLLNQHFEDICRAIAETLGGVSIDEQPPDEIETPPPSSGPIVGEVMNVPDHDYLNIRATASSSSPIIGRAENGDLVTIVGSSGDWYKLKWGDDHMAGVAVYGWASSAYIDPQGEVPTGGGEWHEDITATVFGNAGDEQDSAYPDIDYITGTTRGVALPYKWKTTPRPKITVSGPRGEVTTDVVDLGPWNLDDVDYVLGDARPMVETQYEEGTEAENGQVPSNDAAIDLTKPIADIVGISGKGKVKWKLA